jgi:hypothetical protein
MEGPKDDRGSGRLDEQMETVTNGLLGKLQDVLDTI